MESHEKHVLGAELFHAGRHGTQVYGRTDGRKGGRKDGEKCRSQESVYAVFQNTPESLKVTLQETCFIQSVLLSMPYYCRNMYRSERRENYFRGKRRSINF